MSRVVDAYKANFLQRFDKEEGIPYAAPADFPGLRREEGSFVNTLGVTVRYFFYTGEVTDRDELILFCPGLGPGHAAYMTEIDLLCRAGYRVLTLDYTGCGESGGERLPSVNTPTRDATELLARLSPTETVVPVGHSLGGYTALNVARLLPSVTKAVIISGFVSVERLMIGYVKLPFLARQAARFEQTLDQDFGRGDNRTYLKTTRDRLLFVHSTDDPMVAWRPNAGMVARIGNPRVEVLTVEHKKHNPHYTAEAQANMNAWIGAYQRLLREGKLPTHEERVAFFADKPIGKMTEQDPAVWERILRFVAG